MPQPSDKELEERARRAQKIVAEPGKYKVCEGCESIVTLKAATCPNCNGYRFDADPERVIAQAQILGSRPAKSVTDFD